MADPWQEIYESFTVSEVNDGKTHIPTEQMLFAGGDQYSASGAKLLAKNIAAGILPNQGWYNAATYDPLSAIEMTTLNYAYYTSLEFTGPLLVYAIQYAIDGFNVGDIPNNKRSSLFSTSPFEASVFLEFQFPTTERFNCSVGIKPVSPLNPYASSIYFGTIPRPSLSEPTILIYTPPNNLTAVISFPGQGGITCMANAFGGMLFVGVSAGDTTDAKIFYTDFTSDYTAFTDTGILVGKTHIASGYTYPTAFAFFQNQLYLAIDLDIWAMDSEFNWVLVYSVTPNINVRITAICASSNYLYIAYDFTIYKFDGDTWVESINLSTDFDQGTRGNSNITFLYRRGKDVTLPQQIELEDDYVYAFLGNPEPPNGSLFDPNTVVYALLDEPLITPPPMAFMSILHTLITKYTSPSGEMLDINYTLEVLSSLDYTRTDTTVTHIPITNPGMFTTDNGEVIEFTGVDELVVISTLGEIRITTPGVVGGSDYGTLTFTWTVAQINPETSEETDITDDVVVGSSTGVDLTTIVLDLTSLIAPVQLVIRVSVISSLGSFTAAGMFYTNIIIPMHFPDPSENSIEIDIIDVFGLLHINIGTNEKMTINIYKAGSQITIRSEIFDPSVVPNILLDPDVVELSLYNPAGTLVLNSVNMVVERVGIYTYSYQTPANSVLGAYEATIHGEITSTNSSYDTLKQVVFRLSDQ